MDCWLGARAVKEYQFECQTRDGKVTLSCKMTAASDEDASEIAQKLLLETQCYAVEVRYGLVLIHRATRDDRE